jgi:predicted ArsR family transcriptional regulator
MHAHRGLAQASRLQVVAIVMQNPGISLADLSEKTGLHTNTLRDHVRVLLAEGLIRSEIEHRATRGRPRSVYYAVDAATHSDAAQKRVEEAARRGDLLRRVVPNDDAADLDPDALHQLDALYEHLDEVGLEPEVDEASLEVTLRPCAFHTLVEGHREVLCQVHEGLVHEVLERAGGPVEVERLLPLVTEHRCQLILRLRSDDATAAGDAAPTGDADPA